MKKKKESAKNKSDCKVPWTSSILRWAGSKRKLLPILMDNIPFKYNRYIEPFCGSACLFFAIRPNQAILGDINSELIHCYKILRKHPFLLARAASKIPNTAMDYYKIRKKSPSELNPIDRAARFVYLNRFCFNGVYRTNKKGEFNVPRGTRTGGISSEKAFYRCSYALRKSILLPTYFNDCLSQAKQGDFVYLDPPYATSERPAIEEYGLDSFQHHDIEGLIYKLLQIDNIGASFLLSYTNSQDLLKLVPEHWSVQRLRVRRHVAGFLKSREMVEEVLISNNNIRMGSKDEYR